MHITFGLLDRSFSAYCIFTILPIPEIILSLLVFFNTHTYIFHTYLNLIYFKSKTCLSFVLKDIPLGTNI